MKNLVSATIEQLKLLVQPIMNPDFKYIQVLFGNQKAGKNTLAHYLIQADLNFGQDEDGQDIFQILNPTPIMPIIQGMVQLIPCPQKQMLFLKLSSFPNANKTSQQNLQWSLALECIMSILQAKQTIVNFIFILSLQQVQEDDDIFVKYYNAMEMVPDFVRRTYVVLSKLVDQDQFQQFQQFTAKSINQAKQNCGFVIQIIEQGRLLPFYNKQVDEQERKIFIQKLINSDGCKNLELKQQGRLIRHQISQITDKDFHNFYEQYQAQLKTCLQIINCTIIKILLKGCKTQQDQKIDAMLKQNLNKLNCTQINFQAKDTICNQQKLKAFAQEYEEFIKVDKTLLISLLFQKSSVIQCFYPESFIKNGIFAKTKFCILICTSLSDKTQKSLLQNEDLLQVFFNHDNGFADDQFVLKIFENGRKYFSEEFVKKYQQISLNSSKKRVKKQKKVKAIPNYKQQRQAFIKSQQKLQNLLQSPLKLDLYMEQLHKKIPKTPNSSPKQQSPASTLQQKRLIRKICQILELYECYEQAIKFCWVIPNVYLINIYLYQHLQKLNLLERDLTDAAYEFVMHICDLYSLLNRYQYVFHLTNYFKAIGQRNKDQNRSVNINKISKNLLNHYNQNSEIPESQKKSKIDKIFMNYQQIEVLIARKKDLIQKCINFQQANPQVVENHNVLKWVLQNNQIKLSLD